MKAKHLLLALLLIASAKSFSQSCDCLVPLDTSFHIAQFVGYSAPDYRNDDASTAAIALPFSFQLYGVTYDSIYINNNGNISFDNAYATYSSSGFPSAQFVMVAPFWADVDTRNVASGLVYYKITPTALIVRWQQVGYFNSQIDKMNDFQLVITDGSNSDLPDNYNVQFCYGDMQWTTGSASGGTNGFGGTAATAGVNMGNGVDFWQIGRFDQGGDNFDGPNGANDGVSWLDNKVFYANTSFSPDTTDPLIINTNMCDTVFAPVYNPQGFQFMVIPQFPGTTFSITVDTLGISGFDYDVTMGPGNSYGTVTGTMVGSPTHLGINELVINVLYENPQLRSTAFTSQYRYYFNMQTCALNPTTFDIEGYDLSNLGDTVFCSNQGVTLTATGNYNFVWLNDNTVGNTYFVQPTQPGTVKTVTLAAYDPVTQCATSKTINLMGQLCAGVEDIAAANIKLYPNPATDNLQWSIAQGTDIKDGLLQVYNATGQLVYSKNITSVNESIPLTGLAQGSYYLKTTLQSGIKVMPFVKIDK
jgi:hypothetical protein